MSLVIGSLWPLRIPALPLLMCAGTERERGGRRVGVTPTHQSHPPSIHPSLFLWLIAAANAAAKPPSPVFSAATLKVPLHVFFCFVSPPFLSPTPPSLLVILEYQQHRSAPVWSLAESLSSAHISVMCSPPHALCKVCASQQAICMISSFWAGVGGAGRGGNSMCGPRAHDDDKGRKKNNQKTKHQRQHVSLYLIHESQTLNTKELPARRRVITNDI